MKKVFSALGVLIAALLLAMSCFAAYVAATGIPKYPRGHVELKVKVTAEKLERGRKYAAVLCVGCHTDPTTHLLTGKRLMDVPPEFGIVYSKNITRHSTKGIGAWTDGELAYFLRTGIHRTGQYVPPYMVKLPNLSDDDLESIVAFLRSNDPRVAPADVDPPGKTSPSFLMKVLAHLVFKPLPYPKQRIVAPPTTDKVAYGYYLSSSLGCFACHSADLKTIDEAKPEKSGGYMGGGNGLRDQNGDTIYSANLTPDANTGIGKWTEADFIRAVRLSVRPDRRILVYPMEPFTELTDEDVSALYAYLRTVPPIRNAVVEPKRTVPLLGATPGKRIYYKYGCVSCHSHNGVGLADLRQAAAHFPNDDQLRSWIKNPAAFRPGVKMPAWDGIIEEQEYAPLIEYVKSLGVHKKWSPYKSK